MFLLGIDGGGTHTRLELRDAENHFLRRAEFGPFNLNSIGEPAFRALLAQIFAECGDMTDCGALCAGGAGVSNPRMGQILAEELRRAGFRGRWKLCGDQEIALRGAMDTPGAVVIAGTGSICFGKNKAGESARSGGFGHLIDDGGSGYALGRDVLSEAVKILDGRRKGSMLEAVFRELEIHTPQELVSFVYDEKTGKAGIARLSSVALHQAEAGNPAALEILENGAEQLCALVLAVQRRLCLEGCPIGLLGGLLENDNPYRKIVVHKLSRLGQPISPAHDALWGAAQMVWELAET